MKNLISYLFIFISISSYSQIQHLYADWNESTETYSNPQLFTSKAISEDYGPRPQDGYDFHGGIDIGKDDNTNPSILRDAIVVPMSGQVIFIDDYGTKNILVKFSNNEFVGYRHIFEEANSGTQISGGFVMKLTNEGNLAIINIESDEIKAISTVNGDIVSYDVNSNNIIDSDEHFTTSNTFDQFQLIAPIGNSSNFPAHLHIQSVKELRDSQGNVINETGNIHEVETFKDYNSFNPLYDFDYTGIGYNVIMSDFSSLNQTEYVKIRTEVPEEHRTSMIKRYENGMFDVQNISLRISKEDEDSFSKMKKTGGSFIEFDFGSKTNNFYPLEMDNTNEISSKWKITPTAYWSGTSADYGLYDDYYLSLTDFNSCSVNPNIEDVDSNGLAEINGEALYGDGFYNMKAVLEPVIERNPFFYDNIGPFESSISEPFIINNFYPYIERTLYIYQNDELYRVYWERDGANLVKAGEIGNRIFESGDVIKIAVRASEPMNNLSLSILGTSHINMPMEPRTDEDISWEVEFTYMGDTGEKQLEFTGTDKFNIDLLNDVQLAANHKIPNGSGRNSITPTIGYDRNHKLNEPNPCTITANAGSNVTIQANGSTTLQGSGGTSCSWSPTTGLSNPNSCTPTASPSQTTTYTLTVTENGCTDTDTVTVTVDSSGGGNPPANDDCSNAITLTSSTSCNYTTGTVEDATPSFGANNCLGCSCTSPDDYDVYYKFTAVETSHTVTVSNYASNFDAVIELRTACSSGSSNYISCYDPSGSPSSVSETWNGLTIGQTYYIRVFEWGYQQSSPNNDTFDICVTHNNTNSDGIDLISNITNISNDNPDTGDQITVDYSITNNGDETMFGDTTTALYLSTNQSYGSSDILLQGSVYVLTESLSSSQSLNLESTIVIPNVSDGQYYIISYPDIANLITESEDDNNTDSYAIQIGEIAQNGPDLDVTRVRVNPDTGLVPGQEVEIEIRIENEGNEDSSSFDVLVYLDIDGDNSYDSNEFMGEFQFNSLDAGENDTMFVEFDLPTNISSTGVYELFAVADSNNDISETDEGNNDKDDNITIALANNGAEDVAILNESVSPTNVSAGDTVDVLVNHIYIGNQTRDDLPTLNLAYYLSTDCELSIADDIFLDDDISNLGIDYPNAEEDETLTIPYGTPSGIYYILFVADSENEVAEGALENNNVECVEISVTNTNSPEGDIFITDEICNPTDVIIGSEIEPFANINYSGNQLNADIPSIEVFYYLSNDCVLSNDDLLISDDSLDLGSDLPINDASDRIQLPDNLTPGTYFIIFRADAENVINELYENNNIACAEFNLLPANSNYQDITLNNPFVEVSEANLGDQVYVSVFQNYTGFQTDSEMSSPRLHYYLSTDCELSSDDYYLEDDPSGIGSDDPSEFEFQTVTIPSDANTGDYYILFVADATDIVIENNEDNNLECIPIIINDGTLGIEDNQENIKIKIYPNPVNDMLTINLGETHSKISIEMFNVIGQRINSLEFENKQILSINTSLFSTGIYFFKITRDKIESKKFKIIKE